MRVKDKEKDMHEIVWKQEPGESPLFFVFWAGDLDPVYH